MTDYNFDFSALPVAPTRGGEEPALVNVFAELVNAAPRPLGIKEIIAVAANAGVEVPSEATVRNYLNRAEADGRIVKPTRQTYAGAKSGAIVLSAFSGADETDADPLAGL